MTRQLGPKDYTAIIIVGAVVLLIFMLLFTLAQP